VAALNVEEHFLDQMNGVVAGGGVFGQPVPRIYE
jgi:hypothetical protein